MQQRCIKKMYMFIGFVDENYKYEYEPLPNDAKRINIKGMALKSCFAGLVGIIIGYVILLLKQYCLSNGESLLNRPFILLGIVIGALLLVVHELLHLIPYPRKSSKIVAIKQWTPCAFCSRAISKGAFILSSLLPVSLGVIPILLFLLIPASNDVINTVLWTVGVIGLATPARDYVEAWTCLISVPSESRIQSGVDGFYYYK